jgi:hypothetical protein
MEWSRAETEVKSNVVKWNNFPFHCLNILERTWTNFAFHQLPPKLEGTKLKVSGGMRWSPFYSIPFHSIIIFQIQTMEHYFISSIFIPFHLIPSIQTSLLGELSWCTINELIFILIYYTSHVGWRNYGPVKLKMESSITHDNMFKLVVDNYTYWKWGSARYISRFQV